MDNFREELPLFIKIFFIVVLMFLIYFLGIKSNTYYTKITPDSLNIIGDSYEYNLITYDKNGNEKWVTINSDKLLKINNFYKLKVTFKGVISYRLIKYNSLPNILKYIYLK